MCVCICVRPLSGWNKLEKTIPLKLATWNTKTFLDTDTVTDRPQWSTAVIAVEINRSNVDITAFSETRLLDEGSLIPHPIMQDLGFPLTIEEVKCAVNIAEEQQSPWCFPVPVWRFQTRRLYLHPSTVGWVLAKARLQRLVESIAENLLPQSQCDFRRYRSTVDMVFAVRQPQDRCSEQHQDPCMAFMNLSTAFDTVTRELLWSIHLWFCWRTWVRAIHGVHWCMPRLSPCSSSF